MTTGTENMRVTAVANWYGCARMVAQKIGPLLAGCSLVVVPFAGGMPELPFIDAAKLVVNDKHRHVINLADTLRCDLLGPQLYRRLRRQVFHPATLANAQVFCERIDRQLTASDSDLFAGEEKLALWKDESRLRWAEAYAICTWMSRGGKSGAKGEFNGALPVRYSPDGGGSAQRFHGWVASIPAWRRVFRRCEFTCEDAFDVLAKGHDSKRCGYYCDPPWVGAGLKYTHPFTVADHRRLAKQLGKFDQSRVVLRYGDEPLVRELYPSTESGGPWKWIRYDSRSQQNGDVAEVLILNRTAAIAAGVLDD